MDLITKAYRILEIINWDNAVRDFNNEDLVMRWLANGVPDHYGQICDEDLEWFCEDEHYYELEDLYNELLEMEVGHPIYNSL